MTIERVPSKGSLASSKEKYAEWKPEEKKITPEQEKKEIELIENAPLYHQDKMNLALVYLDEKPAAWIETPLSHKAFSQAKREKEESEALNRLAKEKGKVAKLLDQLNLIRDKGGIIKAETEDTYIISCNFVVGKDPENFSRLQKAIEKGDDKEIGLALGYPKTAVEGYISENLLDYKELRKSLPKEELKELQAEGIFKFINPEFHPSKDHWREELEVVRRHKRLLEEKFPNLYKEIMEEAQDPLVLEEKKDQLKRIRREVNEIRDAEGAPIDPGIKETVVMLKAFDFSTVASCEGHPVKGKISAPWVEISAPNEPEERVEGEKEIYKKIAQKYKISAEEVKRAFHQKAWEEAETMKDKKEETPEYKKWKEENKELMKKVSEFLKEFYKERKVPSNIHLQLSEIPPEGAFRIHNGGEDYRKVPKELTEEEKRQLSERITQYQKEMKEFTWFLKEKYMRQ